MSKTKKQIIIFILIVLIGAGYTINEYVIAPIKLKNQQQALKIQQDKQKLINLKRKSSEVLKLKGDVEKLKLSAASIEQVTVADIDTPQLIFDFYSSCTEYEIKGENLAFQLADSNTKVEVSKSDTANPTTSNSNSTSNSNTTTNKSNNNETTVKTPLVDSNVTTNKIEDINKPKITTDLLKLTIELKVSGDKNKVEKYIRSLSTLTARKINVKSIRLEATVRQAVDKPIDTNQNKTNAVIIPNTAIVPTPTIPQELKTDKVTATIIFNQYVYTNGKKVIRPSNYSFYDENTGFSNFSDMFK